MPYLRHLSMLLLGLLLCWDVAPEADFWRHEVTFAERHITGWVPCATVENPQATCPTYNPFVWNVFVRAIPSFSAGCADSPGDICYFKHPVTCDVAGNCSVKVRLDIDWGGCNGL